MSRWHAIQDQKMFVNKVLVSSIVKRLLIDFWAAGGKHVWFQQVTELCVLWSLQIDIRS